MISTLIERRNDQKMLSSIKRSWFSILALYDFNESIRYYQSNVKINNRVDTSLFSCLLYILFFSSFTKCCCSFLDLLWRRMVFMFNFKNELKKLTKKKFWNDARWILLLLLFLSLSFLFVRFQNLFEIEIRLSLKKDSVWLDFLFWIISKLFVSNSESRLYWSSKTWILIRSFRKVLLK